MRHFALPVMLILTLLAPSLVALRVQATDSAEDMPIVASGEGVGNMWYSAKIPAGTRHVVIDDFIQNTTGGFFFAWANFYYDEQGNLIGSQGLSAAPTDDVFIHIEGKDLPYIHKQVATHAPGYSTGRTIIGCPTCPPISETFTLVTVVTNASGPWNFTVRTNDPVQISVDSGNMAWLYRARDFSGDLNAQLSPGALVRANLNTSLVVHANDTLIGFYRPVSGWYNPLREMWVETPQGKVTCACEFFHHAAGPSAWGPGDYRFHLTDVDADTEIKLFVASIRLPP